MADQCCGLSSVSDPPVTHCNLEVSTRWTSCRAPPRPGGPERVADYGRPLEFGLSLVPEADGHPELLRVAGLADELGLDLLGVQDHPYQARYLETWTLLTAI